MNHQDAERRLRIFEHGHETALVQLASHAALPVVLNPDFVHLLRVNYFLDPPSTLPYTAEADLLLSQLCTEVDQDLYVIDPVLRDVLLQHLIEEYGTGRLRDVARLLWEYGQRSTPWLDRPGLSEVQQLTALNFIDPERARDWLARAEVSADAGTAVDNRWFVAMRQDLEARAAVVRRLEEHAGPLLGTPLARAALIRYTDPDGTPCVGSGLLIDERRVLTADHVANGSGHLVESASGLHDVAAVLRAHAPEVDLAVLNLTEPIVGLRQLKYAQVDRSRIDRVSGCTAVGFPRWRKDGDRQRSAEVDGWIPTAEGLDSAADSGLRAGWLTLISDRIPGAPPIPLGTLSEMPTGPWAGMSGAVVVANDLVIGVVRSHNLADGRRSFTVTPVTAIDQLPYKSRQQFWDALGVSDPMQLPVLPNASVVGTTSELLKRFTDECTVKIADSDTAGGSGFFVAPGSIVSCAQAVIAKATDVTAERVTVEWQGMRLTGRVRAALGPGPWHYPDLCVIDLDDPPREHPWAVLDDLDTSKAEELYLAGFNEVYDSAAFVQGTHARLDGPVELDGGMAWKIADCEIAPGMTGGPVVQLRSGSVCGVTKAIRRAETATGGLMIPAVAIRDAFPDIWQRNRQEKDQNHRWLALRGATPDRPDRLSARLTPGEQQRLIDKAYQLGLQRDDLIALLREIAGDQLPTSARSLENIIDLAAELAELPVDPLDPLAKLFAYIEGWPYALHGDAGALARRSGQAEQLNRYLRAHAGLQAEHLELPDEVRGATEDLDSEAVQASLARDIAEEIGQLTTGKALTIAEFAPGKVTVWNVRPDSSGTPRVHYWRNWDAPHDVGVLNEDELISFMQPEDEFPMLLARTEPASDVLPASLDADRAFDIARAAFPHARAFRSPAPVDDLLHEAIARVPLEKQYELVLLRRVRSGRLELTAQELFPLGARRGDTRALAVGCELGDENGTVFAVVARDAAFEFQLVSMASAKIPPGRYHVTATLLRPGAVRFDGLPVKLREDTRSWQDVLATVPERLDVPYPAHLIAAIETCGSTAEVEERIDRASQLINDVASGAEGPVRFSLLTYASHSYDQRTDKDLATVLTWEDDDHDSLDRNLRWLRARGPAVSRYPRAASIECMLAEVARQLSEHKAPAARPVLVTIGSRPAFPLGIDPASGILPCPLRHDWRVILRQLSDDHAGMAFGAIRDGNPDDAQQDPADEIWHFLGADAQAQLTAEFDVRRFAVDLGLVSSGLQYIPLPLALEEGAA